MPRNENSSSAPSIALCQLCCVSGDRNCWLSKLVDPAQRLITSTAHRLFASVFRKRLPHLKQVPESGEGFFIGSLLLFLKLKYREKRSFENLSIKKLFLMNNNSLYNCAVVIEMRAVSSSVLFLVYNISY